MDEQNVATPGQARPETGRIRTYTLLQEHYLLRLVRLMHERDELKKIPASRDGWLLRLCDRGIYATFKECNDVGIKDEALALLRGELAPV